jgi:uncharacterized protein (DUF736 family)
VRLRRQRHRIRGGLDQARVHHSVKLDDPSFPAPIYASLIEAAEPNAFSLVWSR